MKLRILIILLVLAGLIIVWFLGKKQNLIKKFKEEQVPIVDIKIATIIVASKQYQESIGRFPTGDIRSVSSALMGENEKKIIFIEGDKWTNTLSELIDPWGTPFSYFCESNRVTVKSAGPNKMFGDTDDVIRVKDYGHSP